MKNSNLLLTAACLTFAGPIFAGTIAVPANFQDVYSSLDQKLSAFEQTLGAPVTPSKTAFSAQLLSAACELGSTLLTSDHYTTVLRELDQYKAMGLKAVNVHIDFPVLYPAWYKSQSDYQSYLNFYTQLSSDIHTRGMQLVVESQVVFTQPAVAGFNVGPFYKNMTTTQYENGRAATVTAIAQRVKPDYLSVITEPDTEATQSGKPELDTVSGSTALLNTILQALQSAGVKGVEIGAGAGTWQASYQAFIQSYATTAINYIDCHVYPINYALLSRTLDYASIAAAHGKRMAISEAWLLKSRDNELGTGQPASDLYARDPFSFWAPLDTHFLEALVRLAGAKNLAFVAPFWSKYFDAYLDYATSSTLSTPQLQNASDVSAETAIMAGQYTSTGNAFGSMVRTPADTIAPSKPLSASAIGSGSSIHVTWAASTDNVGVAGYNIYRSGTKVATTSGTEYWDTNLAASSAFTYTLSAYDGAGNVSLVSDPAYGVVHSGNSIRK